MTEIVFNGFDAADPEALEAAFRNEFPDATFNRTVFFAEHAPSYVDVIIAFADVAKYFAAPTGLVVLAKLVEKGKSIREGIEGWAGLHEVIFPGRRRRMAHLHKLAQDIQPGKVSLRIAGRFRTSEGRWPDVWIINEEDPDDKIALLACLGGAIEKALRHLEASGATFAFEPHVDVRADSFSVGWRNHEPSGDLTAVFDFHGKQIGDWVANNLTESQLIQALKEELHRRWDQ